MSGISYILIIDELHRSICARLRTNREETGAYVCPFGPLISPLAGKVQKIRIVFPATLPTRPDLYAVLLLCMVRANTPPVLFLLPPFLVLKDCVFACLHIHTSWNKYGNANGDMTRCAALSI